MKRIAANLFPSITEDGKSDIPGIGDNVY